MSPSTTAVERYQPVLTELEQSTLLGFLAGSRGFTRDANTLDLRQFTAWCWQHDRRLFDVHRVDIGCFARQLEGAGRARATVARRLCTVRIRLRGKPSRRPTTRTLAYDGSEPFTAGGQEHAPVPS